MTPAGRITDVRITRGAARYRLPWWQRWLMPWRWFRAWHKPTDPYMANVTLLMQTDGKPPTTTDNP